MKKLAPLALIAALALTGCAPKALEVVPGPSHMPAGSPVAVSVAEPSTKAVNATPSATPSAPHIAPNTGIKFSGATAELKELAIQEYTAWDEINSKDKERFRGAYKAGHVVMLPKVDSGLEGEFVKILEWSAPSENEIIVRVEGNEWSSLDLRTPPGTVSCALIGDRKSFTSTFVSEDGKTSGNMECKNKY